MTSAPCVQFEYTLHPKYRRLSDRCEVARSELHASKESLAALLADTRKTHYALFHGLTPPGQEYMAGNYRGSRYTCLADVGVVIAGFTGAHPHEVESKMQDFHTTLGIAIQALEDAKNSSTPKLTEPQYIEILSALVAEFFALFLIIHPYANGNGHISRLVGYAMCLSLGRRPKKWPLHKRPPFDAPLALYRQGLQQELKIAVLSAIRGWRPHLLIVNVS